MKWYGWYCVFGWLPYTVAKAAGYDDLAMAFVVFDAGCFGALLVGDYGADHVVHTCVYRIVRDKPAAGVGGEGLAGTRDDRMFYEVERVGGGCGCRHGAVPPGPGNS